MRFAVLGAAGQLGRDLITRLPGEVLPLTRAQLDLNQFDTIPAVVASLNVDVLVNCAAYNFVDRAESEPEAAFAVNAWGARALARACRDARMKLVHFSSDYVFGLDELRNVPYSEDDRPGPVNAYGLSKLAGEYLVMAEAADALVIRTCGLYGVSGSGGKGGNFVEMMLRLANEQKPIRVVNDQRCTPSYSADVADAAVALIRESARGLFHVTNRGSCSWYEFASELFRQVLLKPSLKPISTAEYNATARRPVFSVLSNEKLASFGVSPRREWDEALSVYLIERRSRLV